MSRPSGAATATAPATAAGTAAAPATPTEPAGPELVHRFRAMATNVTMRVVAPGPGADAGLARAEQVFHRVEASCTRFNPDSPLMRANADPRVWHTVPTECFQAVAEAARAHAQTRGLFDPRVLKLLQSWGYDHTLPFHDGAVSVPGRPMDGPRHRARGTRPAFAPLVRATWRPGLDEARSAIRIGPHPVDLGGIGKGLAVRWALEQLIGHGSAALVEAGGDIGVSGAGPEGQGWKVGVEDPRGGQAPVAVLRAVDQAVATSSVRVRQWKVGDTPVHHLIDPRTGAPGAGGLLAVTVLGPDPAWAEVWSKALFLTGRGGLRQLAEEHDLAALWVDTDGVVGMSPLLRPAVLWEAPHAW